MEHPEDIQEEDINPFHPCSDCDGHDACADYGCAIELGIIESELDL